MKLNPNDSRIIKMLLEHGMKAELSKNADAVGKILEVAHANLMDFDILDPKQDIQIRQILSSFVDNGRIKDSKKEENFTKTKDVLNREINDTKFTYETEKIIDVNEQGQAVVQERSISTYGFGFRDESFYPRQGQNALQYPNGPVLGAQFETLTTTVFEEGVDIDYSVVDYKREFVKLGDTSISPNLKEGRYYTGCTNIDELRNYGICFGSGLADVITDVGTFFRTSRREDLTTTGIRLAVGNNDKVIHKTGNGLSKYLYEDGVLNLPDVIIGDKDLAGFVSQELPNFSCEMRNIHSARAEESNPDRIEAREIYRKLVEAHRKNKDVQRKILYNSRLVRLAQKRGLIPGHYLPNKVEFYDEGDKNIDSAGNCPSLPDDVIQ